MLSKKQNSTAILVFANSSQEELKHKNIAKGENLFDALTEQTLETVANTELPYFHFTEKQQVGTTFGKRFTNAIQAVFDKGFDQVITIGNDSPQLLKSHILDAKNQLNDKNFVLGPSSDGGFYLMGIHRSQFNSIDFEKLSWQTADLSKQLLRLVSASSIDVYRLPTLFDIDTIQDIKSLVAYAYTLPEKIMVFLLKLLQSEEKSLSKSNLFVPRLNSNSFHNKGSPSPLCA